MFRIFVEDKEIKNNTLTLDNDASHYLNRVIKIRKGDNLEVVVLGRKLLQIEIESINNHEIKFVVVSDEKLNDKNKIEITLAQCMPKQDKMTEILKKCTEIGVGEFYPVVSERVITKLDNKSEQKKQERWNTAIISAASQSKQTRVPKINKIINMKDIAALEYSNTLKLVFWEEEKEFNLKTVLKTKILKTTDLIVAFIGPEGGLTKKEVDDLKQAGFISVSLGASILRVENAGFAAISNILYELMPA